MSLPEDVGKVPGHSGKENPQPGDSGAAMVTAAKVSMCDRLRIDFSFPTWRMIFGNDNRSVVPASMASGALFMLVN